MNQVSLTMDGVEFHLKEDHDFSWITNYGEVFKVFDQQDSGNICFGVKKAGKKFFIKYAGANTLKFSDDIEEAIRKLKESVPIYETLKHSSLVRLIDSGEIGQGYALIFEWFEGEGLYPQGEFAKTEKYTHPDSPFYRFKQLPVSERIKVMSEIIQFHVHVEEKGYVAIDFYDGSLMYDFQQEQLKICDIDYYQQKPFINHLGRLWGSSRFMSPEEFQLGSEIDGRTNVYNIGAMAFCLLGGELDRSFVKWEASKSLFEVMKKAVEKDRQNRFESLKQLADKWEAVLHHD
ncbi:serine/threonine protein kinase [Alkalihalobacillus alcalophilus ATCC 27647 = CGMCC 1.3604]|uniref:Serine/threonine protein kinase n=1 Tax=Alkalihalobacillus alcalophilus ATCC 27647 = CGMCC 1.3604 TaxID=1218173 RepID=A0A094YXV6_ALKAL|nr:serine/threonine protein kinase [Alkalihalobacillus alcalophilus]KGA98362.1 serine/threonine protein kinase [Alkalihalobacillus alcalophilus ATCC 27647 = CGMCC 1.3604]MED1563661.1 serine/threonine protein kinase [Alkalihalobacillus alcalophilus]THG91608.1 serine/threonine protein kinase [Alkalihalobacillus alcalophilus ATCC 27647 = CGMCC 1.3604]